MTDEWGLSQAASTQPNRTTPAVVGASIGAVVGGVIGYLMHPSFASVAVPAALLGGMGGAIGYFSTNASASTSQ